MTLDEVFEKKKSESRRFYPQRSYEDDETDCQYCELRFNHEVAYTIQLGSLCDTYLS